MPPNPGIYKMVNQSGVIIYVGKAKNLKKRVASYFTKTHSQDFKTVVLVSQIHHIETIVTKTESEALILERQLVKNHQPRYNIQLKDDKSYPFIKVTRAEPFPRVLVVRERKKDRAKYYGPFPSIGSTKAFQRLLLDVFPLRDCKQAITLTKQQPKCLLLDIGRCIGPCVYKNIKPEYDALLHQLHLLLTGQDRAVIKDFKQKMTALAENQEFEQAALYRDKIERLSQLWEKQTVYLNQTVNMITVGLHQKEGMVYVLIQEILEGKLLYQHGYYEDCHENPDPFVEACLVKFLTETPYIYKEIICNAVVHESIAPICEPVYTCTVPQRGVKKELLFTAEQNAKLALLRVIKEKALMQSEQDVIEQLKQKLSLKKVPHRIFGFDISHLQGTHIVASAVSFTAGKADKSEYRKFNIKTITETSNDPESMREVVTRRLKLCLEKNEPLPDLLLIDGGVGQLNYAIQAVASLELLPLIDIVSLAKREELLYVAHLKEPVKLEKRDVGLRLLQQVRDESHRFANTFQETKRNTSALQSILTEIEGVGFSRLKKLYQAYSSIGDIQKESAEAVSKKAQIPLKVAQNIQAFLTEQYPGKLES